MVKITPEEVQHVRGLKHNIRNIAVMDYCSNGKSELTNCLAQTAGDHVPTNIHEDEQEAKQSICLYHKMRENSLEGFKGERQGNNFLINLIHCPEVTGPVADFGMIDGAILVVNSPKPHPQLEVVIPKVLGQMIRPVLTINLEELTLDKSYKKAETAYQGFNEVINKMNTYVNTYMSWGNHRSRLGIPAEFDSPNFDPAKGNVAFFASKQKWAFTLRTFAKFYLERFHLDEDTMMMRLWGDNFFDPETNQWTTERTNSATCERSFIHFCYKPIKEIVRLCMLGPKVKLLEKLQFFGVDIQLRGGKAAASKVLMAWLPFAEALLEMAVFHLPPPAEAQKYRMPILCEGDDGAHPIGTRIQRLIDELRAREKDREQALEKVRETEKQLKKVGEKLLKHGIVRESLKHPERVMTSRETLKKAAVDEIPDVLSLDEYKLESQDKEILPLDDV